LLPCHGDLQNVAAQKVGTVAAAIGHSRELNVSPGTKPKIVFPGMMVESSLRVACAPEVNVIPPLLAALALPNSSVLVPAIVVPPV
jgi:hypothetical protein